MKNSYRLKFIDIDSSRVEQVPDSTITGFMVVRAPKGNKKAIYFPKNSAALIYAMLGIPTANYPDLQDVIDFNNEYGIWVSAPPGTSENYESFYGGIYFTNLGLLPAYGITDRSNINFEAYIPIGGEKQYLLNGTSNSSLELDKTNKTIIIKNIDPIVLNYLKKIRVKLKNKTYVLKYNTTLSYTDENGYTTPVGSYISNNNTIVIDFGSHLIPNFTFDEVVSSTPYKNANNEFLPGKEAEYYDLVLKTLTKDIQFVLDIKNNAYMLFIQKSPTENPTYLTITNIGYDKYYYDYDLPLIKSGLTSDTYHLLNSNFLDNPEDAFLTLNGSTLSVKKIVNSTLVDITSSFKTKYIKIRKAYEITDNQLVESDTESYTNDIYYVNESNTMVEATLDGEVPILLNPSYNTVSFKIEEEVFPGKKISGGEFTGSLNVNGIDSYGNRNYLKRVLPDESYTYIEVEVFKTFDEDCDKGFYKYSKIINPYTNSKNWPWKGILKGQRYFSYIVSDLESKGSLGGALDDRYLPALKEAWTTEAALGIYEDCHLFMEPTGFEDIKPILASLRKSTRKVSTFISGRMLTKSEFLKPNTIIVSGRMTGTAQYVNRFKRFDPITFKRYWSFCIGAIGLNLARIMEYRLGGVAPMYTNDFQGLGGQLNVAVEDQEFDFSAYPENLEIFDKIGLNVVTLDSVYGVMILSQKTTMDPRNASDWSYLGHTMAFDLLKREIRDYVMIPQIGKPNDPYYQRMRREQVETLLARRVSGERPIWSAGVVEVESVNTDIVKAQRNFAILVKVKVYPFSEYVTLTFENVGQTVNL